MASMHVFLPLVLIGATTLGCGKNSFLHRKIFGSPGNKQHSDACSAATVKHLQVKRDYKDSDSDLWTYAFEYLPAESGKPTIVYIPGGPGQSSIGDTAEWLEQLPAGYGLVLTDPRGVGCNFLDPNANSLSFYKSEYVARDVLSLAKELGLSRYSIYGISYGTVVASIAGSLAESETKAGWIKPQSVILEGVLAKAFATSKDAGQMYDNLWHEKLALLRAEAGDDKAMRFKESPMPFGANEEDWGAVIRTALMVGTVLTSSGESMDLAYEIMQGAVSDDSERYEWAKDLFNRIAADDESFTRGSNEFYAAIACQEIFPDWRDVGFSGGEFTHGKVNYCNDFEIKPTALFNASAWPISAPIYYLQGQDDPATPAVTAKLHFDAQTTSTKRQFLEVNRGGHNPFEMNMSDCSADIWTAMTSNTDFKAALSSCEWGQIAGFHLVTVSGATDIGSAITLADEGFSLFGSPSQTAKEMPKIDVRLRSYLPIRNHK